MRLAQLNHSFQFYFSNSYVWPQISFLEYFIWFSFVTNNLTLWCLKLEKYLKLVTILNSIYSLNFEWILYSKVMFGTKLAWQITHNSILVMHFKLLKVHVHTNKLLIILKSWNYLLYLKEISKNILKREPKWLVIFPCWGQICMNQISEW